MAGVSTTPIINLNLSGNITSELGVDPLTPSFLFDIKVLGRMVVPEDRIGMKIVVQIPIEEGELPPAPVSSA